MILKKSLLKKKLNKIIFNLNNVSVNLRALFNYNVKTKQNFLDFLKDKNKENVSYKKVLINEIMFFIQSIIYKYEFYLKDLNKIQFNKILNKAKCNKNIKIPLTIFDFENTHKVIMEDFKSISNLNLIENFIQNKKI